MNLLFSLVAVAALTQCLCPHLVVSTRVLAVLPFPGRSHHMFCSAVLRALLARGHHVVEISPYPPQSHHPNHTHVEIHTEFEREKANWNFRTFQEFVRSWGWGPLTPLGFRVQRMWRMNYRLCEETLNHEFVQKLLHSSDEKFDLILTESTFGEESMLVFAHRFSAPAITLDCFFPWHLLNIHAGNSLEIASVPDLHATVFQAEPMLFTDRLFNLISICISLLVLNFHHLPLHDEIIRSAYPKHLPAPPPLSELVSNVSLYLTNSHPAVLNFARPYSPNVVPIGGIDIDPHRSPLSQDIQRFLDGAGDGFIYMSLGTMVPVHAFPPDLLRVFVSVFNRLRLRVLWHAGLEHIPGLSAHVKVVKWTPQHSVLGHSKCRLFISHGGLNSQHEAFHAGVPTVNFPFFIDQPFNSRFADVRGLGVTLSLYTVSEDSLYTALTAVLSDPRYRENALRVSRLYRDRPVSPAESAVYWVEYVLRYAGGHHLRPAAALLPWYKRYLLDVLAAVLASVVALLALLSIVFLRVLRILRRYRYGNGITKHKAH